jgi:hypothetical protein
MPNKIERLSVVSAPLALTASASTTARIPFSSTAGAIFTVEAVSGATTINWFVAMGTELTPIVANDGSAAVTTTITNNTAYPVPDALFAAPFIVPVLNSGTATIRMAFKG